MGIVGVDWHLPTQPTARLAAERLKRYRQKASGNLFTGGDNHIIFGRVIKRVCLTTEIDEAIRVTCHGRNDNGNLVPTLGLPLDQLCNTADALGAGHRRAAKFHYNARHENL